LQGVRTAPRRLEVRCPLRAILLRPETAMSASRRLAVGGCALLACGAAVVRLPAQDTAAIDRGVRIGISYGPGVRPGMVVLAGRPAALDSVRTIVARDLDYSDRFE